MTLGSELEMSATAQPAAVPRIGVDYVLGVSWLVLVLSGFIEYMGAALRINLYYPMVALFLAYFLVLRLPDVLRLLRKFEFWLWVVTAVVPTLLYFSGAHDDWTKIGWRSRIVFFSIVAGSALVLTHPAKRAILRTSATITLCIAVALDFFELVVPNVFSNAPGRSAGLYINSNDAGAALLVCLLFCVDLARPTSRALLLASVVFAGIVTTFSRSAMLFGALLWGAIAFLPQAGQAGQAVRRQGRLAALLVALGLFFGGAYLVSREVFLSGEARMRIESLLTGNFADRSAELRLALARRAVDRFLGSFWTGGGIGTVDRLHLIPHNTFLYIGIDYGILGVLLYATLLFFGFFRSLAGGWSRAANGLTLSFLLAYESLFTHYVHGTMFFAAAFAALMMGALVDPRARPSPEAEAETDDPSLSPFLAHQDDPA